MGKLKEIYKKSCHEGGNSLTTEEKSLLRKNEDGIQDMLREIQLVCNKYIKESIEFDMTLDINISDLEEVQCRYHNNLFT